MLGTCSQMLWLKNKATQKMLNVKVLRPSKHYLTWDIMISDEGYEGQTFVNITYHNEERITWNIKDNINSYVLLSNHFYFIVMKK
jgi:hypothetical protein